MVKKRTEDPWMSASEYGQGLRGMGVNLLVKDIKRSVAFQVEVLGVEASGCCMQTILIPIIQYTAV